MPDWTALDTVAVAKLLAFGLSFDLDDLANTQRLLTYQGTGGALGFNGLKLFTDDVNRSAPFEQAPSILPTDASRPVSEQGPPQWASSYLHDDAGSMAAQSLSAAEEGGVPTTQRGEHGSNIWVVGPRKARNRRAIIANDPHLALGSPSTFYEVGIDVKSSGTRLRCSASRSPERPSSSKGRTGVSPGARRSTRRTSPTSTRSS